MQMIAKTRRLGRKRYLSAASAVLALAMLASGCGSASDEQSGSGAFGGTYKIGSANDLTGPAAKVGKDVVNGMKYAVEHYNSDSRLKGTKIELAVKDHGAVQSRAATIVNKYIQGDKVDALVGFEESQVALAVLPLIKSAKVPAVSSEVIDKEFAYGSDYTALGKPSSLDLIAPSIEKAATIRDWKSAAILYDGNTSSGPASVKEYKKAFAKAGIELASAISVSSADTAYQADLAKARAADADVVITALAPEPAAQAFKQACDMGWDVDKVSLASFHTPEVLKVAGAKCLEGTLIPVAWTDSLPHPGNKEFVEGYKAKFGAEPSLSALNGYMCVATLMEAAIKAGSTSKSDVAKALHGLTFASPYGETVIDDRGVPQAHGILVEIKGGEFTTLK